MLATGGSRKVEIFDVQECAEPSTCQLPDLQIDLEDAVAKIFDNKPWICGGGFINETGFSDQCFYLDTASNGYPSWKSQFNSSMKKSRSQPAAALIRNKANTDTVNIIVQLQV